MRKTIIMLITGFIFLISCKKKNPEPTRIVFDPGNLRFISSSLNTNKHTMSALYGNKEATRSLSERSLLPGPGSVMKLVTWQYHNNPQYTGGTINGELLSVESVQVNADGKIFYKAENTLKHPAFKQEKRIAYIMSYQPAHLP